MVSSQERKEKYRIVLNIVKKGKDKIKNSEVRRLLV
jgi:hypothetical protein